MNRRWSWSAVAMLALLALVVLMGSLSYAPQRGPNAEAASKIDHYCRLFLRVVMPIYKQDIGHFADDCIARGVR